MASIVIEKNGETPISLSNDVSNVPLHICLKIITFLLPGVLQFIIAAILKSYGRTRQARELEIWTCLGFAFYILIMAIISLYVRLRSTDTT